MARESGGAAPEGRRVFLFYANIIGYVRLALLVAAALSAGTHRAVSFACYVASQLLDMADGWVARRFEQVSVFGASLDQLVDRLSTCLLYLLNAVAFPHYAAAFFLALVADVGGHWLHFFAAAASGSSSHKEIKSSALFPLRAYYSTRGLMALSIVSYEGFFLSLLGLQLEAESHKEARLAAVCCVCACLPLATFKALTNVLQGLYGAKRLASLPLPSACK